MKIVVTDAKIDELLAALDRVVPVAYTQDDTAFLRRTAVWNWLVGDRRVDIEVVTDSDVRTETRR